jgi:hypothetical protein
MVQFAIQLLFLCIASVLSATKRPIDVRIMPGVRADVITPVYRFCDSLREGPNLQATITVDLLSMLHVGDQKYYQSINEYLHDYDVVLFELITSRKNVQNVAHRKRLITEVYSPKTDILATQLALESQLSQLDFQKNRWYVADLEAEQVALLEQNRLSQTTKRYWISLLAGRSFSMQLFSRFCFPLWMLRLLSWLSPCPELSCLLLDWACMSPSAGGLSPLLLPIADNLLRGRKVNGRRLIFAQLLQSGLPDDGAWGGQARSDTDIRVLARNAECCKVLESFINEFKAVGQGLKLRVAVLYGAYHIADLRNRITAQLGLQENITEDNFVAWSVPLKPSATSICANLPAITSGLLLYLTVGALDWWLLIKSIADSVEAALITASQDIVPNTHELLFPLTDRTFAPILCLFYLASYVQRHLFLLQKISTITVQWDRGLFHEVA